MRTVPRLDLTAFKTIRTMMKDDKEFSSFVQNTPVLKNLIQSTSANIKDFAEKDMRFLLLRSTHLQLVQSILMLLQNEPECLITLVFSSHLHWELTSEQDDQGNIVFQTDIFRDKKIQQQSSFWSSEQFVKYLIEAFVQKSPRRISVFRSSASMKKAPIHLFIRTVGQVFEPVVVPTRLKNFYKEKYFHL